jgi:fumarate reductase flavoprotein subunit
MNKDHKNLIVASAADFDMQTDVVVVGAGGAGLCAALTAAEAGAKVVLMENNPFPGGTSNAAEGIFGAETAMQRAQEGFGAVTKDQAFRVSMDANKWQGNARLIRAFINESDKTFDWLRLQGVEFEYVAAVEARGLRTWHVIKGLGAGLVKVLFGKVMQNSDITVMEQTPGQKLITDLQNRVIGIEAKDQAGKITRINARAVVLATGGFAENREWMTKYLDGNPGAGATTPFNKVGDGIRMAMEAGAAVEGMSHMQWAPTADPTTVPLTVSTIGWQPTTVWVDCRGERVCNEEIAISFSLSGNAVRRHGFVWSILDEAQKQRCIKNGPDWGFLSIAPQAVPLPNLDEDIQKALQGKSFVQGDTVEELAAKMGVPIATLKTTIDKYNHYVDVNYDEEFLKPRELLHKLTGKLYAVKLEPYCLATMGGVTVNAKLQALNKNWDVISGLYAVGQDATGGLFGDTYPIELPGTTYGFALTSGRMAAKAILGDMGKG